MFEDKVEDAVQEEQKEEEVQAAIDKDNAEEIKKVEDSMKEDSKIAAADDQPAQIDTQLSLGGGNMAAELAEEIAAEKKIDMVKS